MIPDDSQYFYISGIGKEKYMGKYTCPLEKWNLETGMLDKVFELPNCGDSYAISPNGEIILASSSSGKSPMYAINTRSLKTVWVNEHYPYNPKFSSNGQFFVAQYYGGAVFVFNPQGEKLAKLDVNEFEEAPCCATDFSKDGSLLAIRAANKIEIFETKKFAKITKIPLNYDYPKNVNFTKDSKFIVTYDPKTKYPAFWNVVTGQKDRILNNTIKCEHTWDDCYLSISPNNKWILLGTLRYQNATKSEGTSLLSLIDFKTGKIIKNYSDFMGQPLFTPDSSKLVYTSSSPSKKNSNGDLIPLKVFKYVWNLP